MCDERLRNVEVAGSGADTAMPEHYLDQAQVRPVFEMVGGKAVTKGVRGYPDEPGVACRKRYSAPRNFWVCGRTQR